MIKSLRIQNHDNAFFCSNTGLNLNDMTKKILSFIIFIIFVLEKKKSYQSLVFL